MFYKEIKNHDNDHKFDIDENINITIINKVKIGDCYDKNGKVKYPFYKSFDEGTLNFHIVPKNREYEEYMKKIRGSLDEISNTDWQFKLKQGNKRKEESPAYGHKWIDTVINNICFVLDFQTLSFDKDILNCYLDEIQFVAYPNLEKLNYFSLNGDLHIMYPKKGKNNFCIGNNRVVYNTEFNCQSCSDKVAEEFIKFINEIIGNSNKINEFNAKDSSPKVYSPNN